MTSAASPPHCPFSFFLIPSKSRIGEQNRAWIVPFHLPPPLSHISSSALLLLGHDGFSCCCFIFLTITMALLLLHLPPWIRHPLPIPFLFFVLHNETEREKNTAWRSSFSSSVTSSLSCIIIHHHHHHRCSGYKTKRGGLKGLEAMFYGGAKKHSNKRRIAKHGRSSSSKLKMG